MSGRYDQVQHQRLGIGGIARTVEPHGIGNHSLGNVHLARAQIDRGILHRHGGIFVRNAAENHPLEFRTQVGRQPNFER